LVLLQIKWLLGLDIMGTIFALLGGVAVAIT
jgi:hypothetical protein